MANKPTAAAVAAMAVKRLHGPEIPYGSEDCQKFIKECVRMCGGTLEGRGTNDIYRNYCHDRGEFNPNRPGDLRHGDLLFICEQNGSEPQRYQGDGIGDVNHVGIYCGEQGAEVVHSSQSRGGVAASTLRNAWNRRARLDCLDYDAEAEELEPMAEEPEEESESEAPVTGSKPAASAQPDPGQAMVATAEGKGLNLRKKPDKSGAGIKTMPDGAIVDVLERWGEWAKVRYVNWDGMEHVGWCHAGYLIFG